MPYVLAGSAPNVIVCGTAVKFTVSVVVLDVPFLTSLPPIFAVNVDEPAAFELTVATHAPLFAVIGLNVPTTPVCVIDTLLQSVVTMSFPAASFG